MKNELTRLTGRDLDKLVMRAKNLAEVPAKKLTKDCYECSPKLDGVYCQIMWSPEHGSIQAFSRTGEHLKSVDHLLGYFNQSMYYRERRARVWIGELWHPELDQEVISGMARRHEPSPDLLFIIHDSVDYKDYIAGHSNEPYYQRMTYASRLFPFRRLLASPTAWVWDVEAPQASMVQVLGTWFISLQAAKAAAQSLIKSGHEGIVLRSRDGMWDAGKRNEHYIRIKEKLTYDLEVLDVEEGVGKCAGMAGNLVLRWRLFGRPTGEPSKVQAIGADYETRRDWLHNKHEIIGKIVEVEAMKIGKNGMLREPRVKSVRWDKATADL